MPRLYLLPVLLAGLFLAPLALAGEAMQPDLPPPLFERQYEAVLNRQKVWEGYIYAATAMADGGLAIAGGMRRNGIGTLRSDIWVVRFDASGRLRQERVHHAPDGDTEARAIAALPDGGLLIAGREDGPTRRMGMLMRVDGHGALVWRRDFKSHGSLVMRDIAATPDGGAVAVGNVQWYHNPLKDEVVPVLVAVDSDGTVRWRKDFPRMPGSWLDRVFAAGDGSFIVMGRVKLDDSSDGRTVMALGVGADGRLLWRHDFPSVDPRSSVAYAFAPGLGFAIAHVEDKRTLVIERLNDARQPLWLVRDADLANRVEAEELEVQFSAMLLRPDGGLAIALPTPVFASGPRPRSVLLEFDKAGRRTNLRQVEMPTSHTIVLLDGLVPFRDGLALVGRTVQYTRHGYIPRRTNVWVRTLPAGRSP